MDGNLKKMTENYEKLHRLQMIDVILMEISSYVHDIVSNVEDYFDNCDDFDDHITESVINNTRENIATLNKYLGLKS